MQKSSTRIAFYCSSLSWGGLEMNVVRYARWMKERGWDTVVMGVEGSRIHTESELSGLNFIKVKRNKKHVDLANAFRLSRLFNQHKIDLVWYRDNRDLSVLAWTKWMPGSKFKLLYQQAMQFGVSKRDIAHTIRFKHIDAWVSTLNFLSSQVKEMTSFPHEKIHVIPLGSELSEVSAVDKKSARHYYGLPEDAFVFGILGRLDPLKGQHLLIRALAELKETNQQVHVLIVGESTLHEGNDYENSLKKLVGENSLNDRVHFYGFTKETMRFYAAIDVFVMASKGETFGMVTIEAMSQGKPVIGTNSSGTPEILGNEQSGWLFEPESVSSLKKEMVRVLSSPDEVLKKGKTAATLYQKLYSKKASIDSFESLLASL